MVREKSAAATPPGPYAWTRFERTLNSTAGPKSIFKKFEILNSGEESYFGLIRLRPCLRQHRPEEVHPPESDEPCVLGNALIAVDRPGTALLRARRGFIRRLRALLGAGSTCTIFYLQLSLWHRRSY